MAALRIGPLLSLLVVAELQRGDLTAARHAADRLEQMAEEADVASLVVDGHVARARVLAGSGDEAAAIARSGDRAGAVAEARAALACFERLGADAFRDQVAALLRSLGDTSRARPQRADEVATALSVREQEVLELVSLGMSNAEIASRLFISPKTAEHHVGRILTKLGATSRPTSAAR